MGFKTVYQCLMDVFPQVDSRILKAVAIEHSKDTDLAVDIVLSEVLPFLSRQSVVSCPPPGDTIPSAPLDGDAELGEKATGLSQKTVGSSDEPRLIAEEDHSRTDLMNSVCASDSTCQENGLKQSIVVSCDAHVGTNKSQGYIESEELILLGEPHCHQDILQAGKSQTPKVVSDDLLHKDDADHSQLYIAQNEVPASAGDMKVGHEHFPRVKPTSLVQENDGMSGSSIDYHSEGKDFYGPVGGEFDMVIHAESSHVESSEDGSVSGVTDSGAVQTLISAESCLHSNSCGNNDCKNMNSDQFRKIELLEQLVEAAKKNKKTLFSAMESVMNMMKEVEFQETAAEQAKDEVAMGGLDILVKVEELKQILAHAKEANDMHAGEVHGEKAILAAEARELQARLVSLSNERDKALAILDEMHQTLESRLATAEELRKAAEVEKLEKEEIARSALAEQEIITEKVVEESKIIQKEAEENAKLREFLIDRGHIVDTLQGEISVICQDVRVLKEKFDQRVPWSKSVSSSQTSCILASSGSSVKSMGSDLVPQLSDTFEHEHEKERCPSSTSLVSHSQLSETSEHEKEQCPPTFSVQVQSTEAVENPLSNEKLLLDDGWDLLEE